MISRVVAALALWLGIVEASAAWWYRPTASNLSSENDWKISWPTNEIKYAEQAVPEASKELLRYDEGGAASWNSTDAHSWLMYYFRWLPGRTAALFVRNHRPDVCLPASGMTLEQDRGFQVMQVNGIDLPVHAFRFDDSGRTLDVFYCYWDARSSYGSDAAAANEDWTMRGRLRAAWKGQREVGTRMLELASWDYPDAVEATDALRQQLVRIIEPKR